MDPFAVREGELAVADVDGLRLQAAQVDLDPALGLVVAGVVAKAVEIEVGAQLAIGPGQQIAG